MASTNRDSSGLKARRSISTAVASACVGERETETETETEIETETKTETKTETETAPNPQKPLLHFVRKGHYLLHVRKCHFPVTHTWCDVITGKTRECVKAWGDDVIKSCRSIVEDLQ